MDFLFYTIFGGGAVVALIFVIHLLRPEPQIIEVKIVELIAGLCGDPGSGHSIEITCENEEPATIDDQCQVLCNGDWTGWNWRSYTGRNLFDALQKAAFAKKLATEYPGNRPLHCIVINANCPTQEHCNAIHKCGKSIAEPYSDS